MAYKKDDEKLIGKNLKKLREERKMTQQQIASALGYDRTVYSKWENGTKIPSKEQIESIAEGLQISADELFKNISAAIVHTSALMKNVRILGFLLEDYARVIVPDSVMKELEAYKKGARGARNKRTAWQVMMKISQYQVDKSGFSIEESEKFGGTTKENMIRLAEELQNEQNGDVFIIHDDISFSVAYKDNLLLKDYMAQRSENIGYYAVLKFMEEWDDFEEIDVEGVNLDAYLPDGMTLLIDCIRCNTKEKREARGGDAIPTTRILQKIQFLLDHGADINKTDRWKHCLTPLAHCVQVKEIELFDYLIKAGADYNMGSIDTLNTSNFRMQNEGNTPLMIACYEGKKQFVDRFLKLADVSFNQQDANGYTALIKTAVGRNDRLKKGEDKYIQSYQYIYDKLSELSEVDKIIRDRKNKTAADYWNKE